MCICHIQKEKLPVPNGNASSAVPKGRFAIPKGKLGCQLRRSERMTRLSERKTGVRRKEMSLSPIGKDDFGRTGSDFSERKGVSSLFRKGKDLPNRTENQNGERVVPAPVHLPTLIVFYSVFYQNIKHRPEEAVPSKSRHGCQTWQYCNCTFFLQQRSEPLKCNKHYGQSGRPSLLFSRPLNAQLISETLYLAIVVKYKNTATLPL